MVNGVKPASARRCLVALSVPRVAGAANAVCTTLSRAASAAALHRGAVAETRAHHGPLAPCRRRCRCPGLRLPAGRTIPTWRSPPCRSSVTVAPARRSDRRSRRSVPGWLRTVRPASESPSCRCWQNCSTWIGFASSGPGGRSTRGASNFGAAGASIFASTTGAGCGILRRHRRRGDPHLLRLRNIRGLHFDLRLSRFSPSAQETPWPVPPAPSARSSYNASFPGSRCSETQIQQDRHSHCLDYEARAKRTCAAVHWSLIG